MLEMRAYCNTFHCSSVHPKSVIKVQVFDDRKSTQKTGGLVGTSTIVLSEVLFGLFEGDPR